MDQDRKIVPVTDDIADILRDPIKENPLFCPERALMKRVYSESQQALINKNRTTFRKAIKQINSPERKI